MISTDRDNITKIFYGEKNTEAKDVGGVGCARPVCLWNITEGNREILLRIACIGTGSQTHSAIRVIFTMFG